MGPLRGIKIVELAGIGPGPMCAMTLADLGATVLRIERVHPPTDEANPRPLQYNLLMRNRKSIALNLKEPAAVELVMVLIEGADAFIEGFRPGVTERLGLGPDACLKRNPRLVYGRVTGWGQDGPLSLAAGHDINYMAITGALHAIGGRNRPPTPPLNLIGDYAGGALFLAVGILAAILESKRSGKGQVVDACMAEAVLSLMSYCYGLRAGGLWNLERGTNRTDGGAWFYGVYECSDAQWVSIALLDKNSFSEFLRRMEIDPSSVGDQANQMIWQHAHTIVAARFKTRTRNQWCELLEGTDACFAPVLSMSEVAEHPHNKARGSYAEIDGVLQPMPAPRFSRTVLDRPTPPLPLTPKNTEAALSSWLSGEQVAALRAAGTLR